MCYIYTYMYIYVYVYVYIFTNTYNRVPLLDEHGFIWSHFREVIPGGARGGGYTSGGGAVFGRTHI